MAGTGLSRANSRCDREGSSPAERRCADWFVSGTTDASPVARVWPEEAVAADLDLRRVGAGDVGVVAAGVVGDAPARARRRLHGGAAVDFRFLRFFSEGTSDRGFGGRSTARLAR